MKDPVRNPREIDLALMGRLSVGRRRRLLARLRQEQAARARYDRGVALFRALEGRDVAQFELAAVEQWLEDEGMFGGAGVAAKPWHAGWIAMALAVAAMLALLLRVPPPQNDDSQFAPRGTSATYPLGLQVLCDADGQGASLRDATEVGCPITGKLGFAVRIDQAFGDRGTLTLFGVDGAGEVVYYLPTPQDLTPHIFGPGQWQPLTRAVSLQVNHHPGPLHIYGLIAPREASITEVDEIAGALRDLRPGGSGADPWHRGLSSLAALQQLCVRPEVCTSAKLEIEILGTQP